MSVAVTVYRSKRIVDMYLYVAYVEEGDDLEAVPEALLRRFGTPVEALRLALTADRKLARVAAADVLAALEAQGYYLQLPPDPRKWATS